MIRHAALGMVALTMVAQPATAAVLFDNATTYNMNNGTGNFSTSGGRDGWEAQAFTLSGDSVVQSFSFVAGSAGHNRTDPVSVSWKILSGGGALPGATVAFGTLTRRPAERVLPIMMVGGGMMIMREWTVAMPEFALGSGSYYIAIQAATTDIMYLANGVASTGRSSSWNGGGTWNAPFIDASYAVRIDGRAATVAAVPEPATWAMMLVGFGTMAGAMRLRRRRVAFA